MNEIILKIKALTDANGRNFRLPFTVNRSLRFGFTLAEVLVTLGIIGVVAAMTIPTLVKNYQKTQYVTAAKKFYTQFNQVLQQMAVESGENDSVKSYFGSGSSEWIIAIKSHYKIIKDCGYVQDEECFAKFDDNYDGSAGSASIIWDSYAKIKYKFVTADGISFAMNSTANGCTSNYGFDDVPTAPTTNHTCAAVYVDINGKNKPNYYGRDVFSFYITSNQTPMLYPYGGFYNSSSNTGTVSGGGDSWWNYNNAKYCGNNASKFGIYCAGRLIENGWVMDW